MAAAAQRFATNPDALKTSLDLTAHPVLKVHSSFPHPCSVNDMQGDTKALLGLMFTMVYTFWLFKGKGFVQQKFTHTSTPR